MSPALALESEIYAVTVFRRGAAISRRAPLLPENGRFPELVRLSGLPLSLDDSSLSVAIHSEGDGPVAADLRIALETPSSHDGPGEDAQAELRSARDRVAQARAEVSRLERALEALGRLGLSERPPGAEGQPPRPSPTEARISLLRFRTDRAERLSTRLEGARRGLDARTTELRQAEQTYALASTDRPAQSHELRKSVLVRLRAPPETTGPAQLELRYHVLGARWSPAYAVRLNADLEQAEFQARALVRQRTGEDWSQVALTLSTASLQTWQELPELKALRIGRAQPPSGPTWRAPPTGAEALYANFDARCPPPPLFAALERASSGAPPPEADMEFADEEPTYGGGNPDPLTVGAGDDFDRVAMSSLAMPEPDPRGVEAPAPARMKRAKRRSRSGLGDRDLPLPSGAPAPAQPSLGGGLPTEPPPGRPDPVIPELDERLRRYGQLRMPGPREPDRGALRPAEQVFEDAPPGWTAAGLAAAVRSAAVEARLFEDQPAPKGHRFAEAPDNYDYAFRAAHPASMASDGEDHHVPLRTETTASHPRFVCVPRETRDVFRLVAMDNPMDAPLLAGPVDVYVADEFVLTSEGSGTPPRGRLELGLGVEQGLRVARNTRFEEQSNGLMRGSLDIVHEITMELRNNLDKEARFEVRERLPVARKDQEDDVKINIESVEPAWRPYEPPNGLLEGGQVWELTVPPGERRSLFARYSIRIPASKQLVGGNRRES